MLAESVYQSLGLHFLSKIEELAFYVTDTQGRVLFWNQGASTLFGWQKEDVITTDAAKDWKDSLLFPLQEQMSGECDRQRIRAVRQGLILDEQRYVRQNGSHFLGMSLLLPLHGKPGTNSHRDSVRYFVRIVRDITDQKKNVERLKQALDLQNHVTETMKSSQLPTLIENAFPGLRLSALYHPTNAEERVGGDFYDALRLSDGGIAIFVGDASGKGLRASSRATEVRYSLRALLREDPDPARAVSRVNNVLCQNALLDHRGPSTSESMMLTTLTLAVIYPQRREMQWVHAGGEFPIIHRMNGVTIPVSEDNANMMLGIAPDLTYKTTTTTLLQNDVVLLFTDGITESRKAGRFFGTDGVTRSIEKLMFRKAAYTLNPQTIVEEVLHQSLQFAEKTLDDMCLLAVQLLD